jgi:hypothetical protein
MATFATPWDTEQARPERPAGQHRQLDRRQLPRRQPDHHHLAGRRQRLEHLRRLGHLGQGVRLDEALLHHLAGSQQVGARLEDQLDP